MDFHRASGPSEAAFAVIVVGVLAMFVAGVRHAYRADPARAQVAARTTGVVAVLWLALIALTVGSGFLARLPLHGIPMFFGAVLLSALAVGFSPLGRQLATQLELKYLVLFQAFRLPLEFVLHDWAAQKTIPGTMTWTGQNWDIASGIVALLTFAWADRFRAVAWFANIAGSLLLLNVMRVALLSSPVPFGWPVIPPLLLAHHLPYAWIGPICVGGALIGHIVLTRALLQRVA